MNPRPNELFPALRIVVLALVLAGLPTVARAGVVYVALASDGVVDGLEMETEVLVTNTRSDAASVEGLFIPAFRDGTQHGEETERASVVVQPFRTVVFDGLTDGSLRGLLQVSAPDGVMVSARLAARRNGETRWTPVPVIGSEEVLAAGQFHALVGWRRDSTHRTSFGLVNVSEQANDCAVEILAADGGTVLPQITLRLSPRSLSYYSDVVLAAGRQEGRELRAEIQCQRPAFTYSVVRNLDTGDVLTLLPAADTASTLTGGPGPELGGEDGSEPPDDPPVSETECPTGSWCFERAGVFHEPTRSVPVVRLPIPVPGQTYSSVSLRMEFVHGGWSNLDPAGLHGLFWLYRNGRWRGNTFGYANVRGPDRNILANLTNVDLPAEVNQRETERVDLVPGQTYVVDYLYDAAGGLVRTTLLRTDGSVVAEILDVPTANRVEVQNGFDIEVGLEDIGSVEVPTVGWRYRNLVVTFTP